MSVMPDLDGLRSHIAAAGLSASVSAGGVANDIAIFDGVAPEQVAPFAAVARAFGFRYVTVDLATLENGRS